jgi:hypothetical protein
VTTRPRLLIVSISNISSDPRVLKQVELFRDDYEVSTCGIGPAVDGIAHHYRLPDDARGWVNDTVALATRRYRKAYWNLPAVKSAVDLLPVGEFDIVLANDLNTVPLALSLGARKGVHADLHEFAPREKDNEWRWRAAVAPFMRWLCRAYLVRVDSATTVGNGIARQYEKDYGIPFGVVTNAAPYAALIPRPVGDPIRLVHSGAAQRFRRLHNYIEAMRSVQPGVTLDFVLMPNEPDYLAEMKQLAADVPAVTFREPVPYPKLVETMAEYDVAITVLPPVNFNQANALPNKFFESVQARIGQIIGPSPEMAEMITHYGFGMTTDGFGALDLRKAIRALDAHTISEWKRAADGAAEELSSEKQIEEWATAIGRLAER